MKIVAAVRNNRAHLPAHAVVNVKSYTPGVFGAVIERREVGLVSTGRTVGEYTFFSGSTEASGIAQYDVVSGGDDEAGVVKVEFLSTALFVQSQDESGCVSVFRLPFLAVS